MKIKFVFALNCCLLFFMFNQSNAQVKLPRMVRDSMILQRDVPVNIWGWASVNEKVKLQFNGKTYKTRTNNKGEWKLQIPPVKAGGPFTMEITASNKIIIHDILFET